MSLGRVAWIAAVLVSLAIARGAEAQPPFPVPRAQEEFRGLTEFVNGFGGENKGDVELFRRWTLPFAPMDLQVGNASHDEASALRSLYLGIAGAAFGVDAAKLAASFHCGQDCIDSRRRDLESNLPRIERLVGLFRKLEGVDVVAAWGIKDQYRVNGLYKIGTQANVTSPSPKMGFVPSDSWKPVADPESYFASLGVSPEAISEVLSELVALSIAAVVREADGGIRVVRIGISDNESGLYFPSAGSTKLKLGDKLRDGREIKVLEELKKDMVFYEST